MEFLRFLETKRIERNKYSDIVLDVNLTAQKKMISKAMEDDEINHEEFTLVSTKRENSFNLKENIRISEH